MAKLVCPNSEELWNFAEGKVDDVEFARIETHLLSGCETCVAALGSCEPNQDDAAVLREVQGIYRADEQSLAGTGDRRLGPYELNDLLGTGGMGQVWRATHTLMTRSFAVKIISPKMLGADDAVRRFEREIKAIGVLDSPHIVRATHADVTPDGVHYLVMDLVDGLNLSELIRCHGPLAANDACEIARQVAAGLAEAHRHGLVHRDIKPSNIMLGRDGVVRILDFGVARFTREVAPETDERHSDLRTGTGQIVGTPSYMAPEQRHGETVDIRADLYSLGLTLCRLLYAGQEGVPVVLQSNERVGPDIVKVLARLVTEEPADRFATPTDVVLALTPLAQGANLTALIDRCSPQNDPSSNEPTPGQKTTTGATAHPKFRNRSATFVGIASILLLLIGGALYGQAAVLFVTNRGQLEVTIPDGQEVEAKLVVRRGEQIVEIVDLTARKKKQARVTIGVDEYGLKLEGAPPGYSLETDRVTIRRGKQTLVHLRFTPAPEPGSPKPASPAALAQSCAIFNGHWRVEGTELVQDRYDHSYLYFGDPQWSDYDFSVEAKKVSGTDEIALAIRTFDPSNGYRFAVGGANNTQHVIHCVNEHRNTDLMRSAGSIPTGEWIKLRVRARGQQLTCFIDDQEVTSIQDVEHERGCVGLETVNAPTRFRNIKVTDPDGKVLFEGLPQLANVRVERTTKIVPHSEQQPSVWKYSFSSPDSRWFVSDFDDSSWSEGLAPFGSGEPGIRTSWKTPQIWIRRWFTLPESPLRDPHLFLYTDNDSTVYLNGILAAQDVVHLPGYRNVRIRPEAQATLKPGRNHIAIACLDSGGGRFIDAGLVDVNWETQTFKEELPTGGSTIANAFWRTEGSELVQSTNAHDCRIFFGDSNWENYDFSLEARRISGMEGMSLMFGVQDEHRFLNFLLAGWKNTRQWLERIEYLKEPAKDNEPPREHEKFTYLGPNHYHSLQANRWYKLKVEVRGRRIRGFVDDQIAFSFEDEKPIRGAVGLRTWARYRFRNLRVTDPDGIVLWSGVPKLPAPRDSSQSHLPINGTKTPGVGQLDAVMLKAMDHPDSLAITLAIGHEGQLLYSRGYGWQDQKKLQPARADMLFGTTRWVQEYFINAAIKRLERTGKLKLDDRLLDVLPLQSQVKIEEPRFRDITIRHLLEMKSGWGADPVATVINEAKRLNRPEPYRPQTLLELMVAKPLVNDPGSKSETCGFNHAVLKAIVVQISGRQFDDYAQNELFAPLVVPEFAELRPNGARPPRAAWNAGVAAWNAGAAANPDHAGVSGIPFCASAPGLYQLLCNYSPAGDPQNGDGWWGGFNWHSHANNVSGSHAWVFWRGDKLEIAVLHNGPLKADYDWIREMDQAIEHLKWLWLVR